MKNVPTYLPPPAAQRKVQPAELVLNHRIRVGVNTELGIYEPEWQTNHQLLEHVEICSRGIWSVNV